jgi:hypothetical protein
LKETDTNREIIKSICRIPCSWAWKIPDASPKDRLSQRFVPARAFDIAACIHGQFYAIEGKIIKGLGGLSVDGITEFEKRCLAGVGRAGGSALLAIVYHATASERQIKRHSLPSSRVRELYLVPFERWLELEAKLQEGKKSVTRPDIIAAGTKVPWLGKGFWDIEKSLYDLHLRSEPSSWRIGAEDDSWEPFNASRFGAEK